jgi:hypothetical protein
MNPAVLADIVGGVPSRSELHGIVSSVGAASGISYMRVLRENTA